MLGLGSSISRSGKIGPTVLRDNLVLKHDYYENSVQPVSTGAADINADAAANEYIDVGTTTNIGTSDVSFSAWVYITSFVNYGGIFGARKADGVEEGFEVRTMSDSTIEVILDDGGSSASMVSSVLNTNQWYHVGVSIDRDGGAGGAQLYIDGVKDGDDNPDDEQTSIGSIGMTTKIGQHYTAVEMQGYICNVGYWLGTALTQPQVKSIMHKDYAALSASEKEDLVSWWNLDSAIGESTSTGASTRTSTFVLDNYGYSLGSEMVTNFGFEDSSQTSYSTSNATYEYVSGNNGLAITTTGTGSSPVNQTVVIPVSPAVDAAKKYLLSFDIVSLNATTNAGVIVGNISAADIHVDKGGTGDHYWYPSTVGSHSSIVTFSSGGTITLSLHAGTAVGSVATFDNLSFKEITGNIGTLS
jgi:hypothetical protein